MKSSHFHLVGLILLTFGRCVLAADFHVANQGKDSNPGTESQPFATWERARDAVREWRKSGTSQGSATIQVHEGMYELDSPLVLNEQDSGSQEAPTVWQSYQGRPVVVSGGRTIHGFRPVVDESVRQRLPDVARDHVLEADLAEAGVNDFGDVATLGKRIELFFDGKPMTLARWPNQGFVRIMDVTGGHPIVSHGIKGDAVGKFTYEGDEPSQWAAESDVWVSGYWFWDWSDGRQQVKSIEPATHTIELIPPHHSYGYRKGQRFYAFNILRELDSPGEWYLDRKRGTLYFWPPDSSNDIRATLSVTPTAFTFKGASWIQLKGLQIEATRSTAIEIHEGTSVQICGCVIRNTGSSAVVIQGGTNHGVTGCDISQIGESGISMAGGDRQTLTSGGHFVDNNHIHHFSRLARTYRPAVGLSGVGLRATHNLIHDAPHTAILIGGNEHLVEFNEIHHVCQETGDVGAFYIGRDWTMRGNTVKHNYFHDLTGPGLHGAMAVYLDDAASGTMVYGNLFYRASRAAFIGGGRDNVVENNIFVECKPSVHLDARGLGWMRDTVEPGGIMDKRLNDVPFQRPPWSIRYPELVKIREENPPAPQGNKVVRNISVAGRWLDLEKAAEPGIQFEGNLVDQDPGFVDAANLNFQLRSDSPAFAIGFRPIPIDKIGLRDDEIRKLRPSIHDHR